LPTQASHVWRPSSARALTLDGFVPVPRGTNAVAPAPLSWPIKDPSDLLDYQLDIAAALVGNDGDGIATLDVTIWPQQIGGLALASSTADGTCAVLWLSGGQVGTNYVVTLRMSTMSGRALARDILLPVLQLATPVVPTNALATESGAAVTTSNGSAITTS
jgi:hypothetical protein